jgi:hypothetical protein
MTKTKITFGLSKCWRAISTGVLAVLLTTSAYAQVPFSCIGDINASLGTTCARELMLGELLTSGSTVGGSKVFIKRNGVYPPFASPNPEITSADIGRVLEVKIDDGTHTCWGYVTVEDKDAPTIKCPDKTVISCLQNSDATATGTGTLISGSGTAPGTYKDCSNATVTYIDQVFENSCTNPYDLAKLTAALVGSPFDMPRSGSIEETALNDAKALLLVAPAGNIIKFIFRKFTVTDAYNNATSCYQVIGVKRMDGTMTIVRPLDTTFNCSSNVTDFSPDAINARGNGFSWAAYPLLLIPKAGSAAYVCGNPFDTTTVGQLGITPSPGSILDKYDVIQLKPDAASCGVSVTYTDGGVNLCTGSFKKLRNWSLQNWCGAPVTVCGPNLGQQAIKNLDLSAPIVKATYTTYDTASSYICVKGADGKPLPRYLVSGSGVYSQNPATFKTDVSSSQIVNAEFGGKIIDGTATPDVTFFDVTALGNSNSCNGNVVFQLSAKDIGCTAIGDKVTLASSDNRLVVRGTNFDPSTGETTFTLAGDFDLTTDVSGDKKIDKLDGLIVTLTVSDACGYAKATQRLRILVIDNAKPQPVCNEYLQLALGSDGTARLQASAVNRASTDNCTNTRNLRYLVRKMKVANADGSALVDNPDECFSAWVDFTCFDAIAAENSTPNNATATTIGVVMRVCDEVGNYNDCMTQILVENKAKPTCIAPPNKTIACNSVANLYNTAGYGTPSTFSNCKNPDLVELPTQFNLNNCRQGTIVRSWSIADKLGNTGGAACTQTITVTGVSDFTVDFPDDMVAKCFDDVQTAEEAKNAMLTNPVNEDSHIENNGCGVIAVEVSDVTPSATTDGSCYKIFRKYRVIDWCRYNPNNTNDNVNCYGRPVAGDAHRKGFAWDNAVTGNSPAWENLDVAIGTTLSVGAVVATTPRTQRGNVRDRKFRDADIYNFSGLTVKAAADKAAFDAAPAIPAAAKAALLAASNASAAALKDSIALNYPDNTFNTAFLSSHKDYWSFGDGIICFTQTIKLIDNVAPVVVEGRTDLEICDYGTGGACGAQYKHTLEGSDACQGGITTTGITYAWEITRKDVPTYVRYKGTTNAIDVLLPYDSIFVVKWSVSDKCGNSTPDTYEVRFRDCKKPSIICLNVNAEVMPTTGNVGGGGQIEIWPKEFYSSVSDNCTPNSVLKNKVRVRKAGTGTNYPVNGTSVIYTCDDYTASATHTGSVEVWVEDEAGKSDFCLATVTLQNNMSACGAAGDKASISGGVQTEARANIENVTMKATMNGTQVAGSMVTRADGAFALAGLTTAQNYAVRGERTDNPLNGVTTYDIALISRHILGTETLNTPYKIIAADVNGDRDINTGDMIALRRAVLHLSTTFPNNVPSWRFINKNYTFRNAANPLAEDFPEVVNIANAARGLNAADFTGVKVGDVNGNAAPSGVSGLEVRGAAGALTLKTDDLSLVAGKTYTVQLKSDDFKVAGVQGTFNFAKGYADQISVLGHLPNMTEGNFGVFENAVTTSWNGQAAAATDVLTLTFRARQNGKLSDVLSVGSNLTYAEGYDAAGDSYSVNLSFNNGKVSGKEFALYQNEPNPFDGTTKIGFSLPESAKATLTIYDVTGKLLRTVEGNYTAGYNALSINKSELNANGVMYYRLDSGNNTATKKMIIIE